MARHLTENDKATQGLAEAGSDNTTWMSPLRTAQAVDAQVPTYNFSSDDFAIDGSNNVTTKKGHLGSSGTILFDRNRVYGTVSTPLTGNITSSYTGATVGSIAIILHADTSEPTYPDEFVTDSDSDVYSTTSGDINVITCKFISSELIIYSIDAVTMESIDSTMVLHFEFEEGSGSSAVDSSTYGNDGVIVNNTDAAWVSGPIGNAIDLGNNASDGSRSYITVATSASTQGVTTAFTVAFWYKFDALGGETIFVTGDYGSTTTPGIHINTLSDGRMECYINPEVDGYVAGARVRTTATVSTSVYKHFAFTYNGTTLQAYIDGSSENSNTISGKDVGNSLTWYINSRDGSSNGMGTNFDDFRVYDRALNSTEIGDLHALGS